MVAAKIRSVVQNKQDCTMKNYGEMIMEYDMVVSNDYVRTKRWKQQQKIIPTKNGLKANTRQTTQEHGQ